MTDEAKSRLIVAVIVAGVLLEQYGWYRHRRLVERINREMRESVHDAAFPER